MYLGVYFGSSKERGWEERGVEGGKLGRAFYRVDERGNGSLGLRVFFEEFVVFSNVFVYCLLEGWERVFMLWGY